MCIRDSVKAVIPYGAQYKPAVAADGVTPVLQKQLTHHTENAYKMCIRDRLPSGQRRKRTC